MKGIYLSFCVYPAETKGPQPTSALKMFSNPPGTGGLVDWWLPGGLESNREILPARALQCPTSLTFIACDWKVSIGPKTPWKKPSFSWQTFYKEFRPKLETDQELQKVSIPQYAISSYLCFGCFLTPPDFIWFPDAKSWVRKWWLQRVSEDTRVRQQAPQLRSCWCVQGRQWGLGGWMHSQAATVQVFWLFQMQPSRAFVMSISIFILDSFPRCMLVQALNNYRLLVSNTSQWAPFLSELFFKWV